MVVLAEVFAADGCLAPTLTYATSPRGWVIWPRSVYRMAKDPGAKLVAA